jgi:CheY-like chemotaxis protein
MNGHATSKNEALTILCVDDSTEILVTLREILQSAGYRVLEASTGSNGLALFVIQTSRIDAAILDFHLPDMTGKDIAIAIRKVRPDLPIILFSGDARIFSPLVPNIFDACVEKPLLAVIPTTLQALLNRRIMRDDACEPEGGMKQLP